MARIRNIKPGFALNEDLASLPVETRYFFIMLWTQADWRGRLEDRPAKLNAAIFPYRTDNFDVDKMLTELSDLGFVIRYEGQVGAKKLKLLQVVNFEEHQRFSGDEIKKESIYPSPSIYNNSPPDSFSINVIHPGQDSEKVSFEMKSTFSGPEVIIAQESNDVDVWIDALGEGPDCHQQSTHDALTTHSRRTHDALTNADLGLLTTDNGLEEYAPEIFDGDLAPVPDAQVVGFLKPSKTKKLLKPEKPKSQAEKLAFAQFWKSLIDDGGVILTDAERKTQAKACWAISERAFAQFYKTNDDEVVAGAEAMVNQFLKFKAQDNSPGQFFKRQPRTPLSLSAIGVWGQVLESLREKKADPVASEIAKNMKW